MNDNKNQNQPNPAASDYQKILDEYAASVKPGDADPEVEVKKPEIDLNITTSLKEAPVKPEENKIPEIKPDITEIIPSKPAETFLKSVNSPQLESPIHPSLAANLEGDDIPEKPIISSQPSEKIDKIVPPVIETEVKKPMENISNSVKTPIIEPPLPTSEISPPQKTPEEVKAEINRLLEDDDQSQTSSDSITPKTGSNMGKIFFIFALILFLAVAAGLAYFLFLIPLNSNNSNNSFNSVTPIITKTEDNTGSNTTGSGTCELNDKTYQVGESFASADGCNTCNCSSAGVITCTEKACAGTPTVTTATKSATTTSSIPSGWKTYTDSTYKFSINYPSDWVINKEINSFSLASAEMNKKIKSEGLKPTNGPEISVSVYDSFSKLPERMIGQSSSKNTKTLKEYVNFYLSKVKEITINGINGYSGYTELPSHDIYLQKGNIIIFSSEIGEALTNYGYTIDQKTIDTIINTIKFN